MKRTRFRNNLVRFLVQAFLFSLIIQTLTCNFVQDDAEYDYKINIVQNGKLRVLPL